MRNELDDRVMKGAITGGHLEIAKLALARKLHKETTGVSFDHTTFKTLAMPMAEWLVSESRWPDEEMRGHWINITILNAVKLGHLEAVKFLYPFQEYEIGGFMFMETAAECGRLDILKWLHGQGADYFSHDTDMAARNGILMWFSGFMRVSQRLLPSAR